MSTVITETSNDHKDTRRDTTGPHKDYKDTTTETQNETINLLGNCLLW